MRVYDAIVACPCTQSEQPTLLAIAGILGTNVDLLKVDRSKKHAGAVLVEVQTARIDVVRSIQGLQGVLSVKPRSC